MTTDIVILGAGGHARVVADALMLSGRRILGFLDSDPGLAGGRLLGLPILGGDDLLASLSPGDVELANGIGSAGSTKLRRDVYGDARKRGFRFTAVIHPSAVVAASAVVGDGAQILARAVVQPLATIGENSIVNTGAIVEHDAVIGAHVHISPGCVLGGGVRVGDGAHVGLGAVVVQRTVIGVESFVAAGAVVVGDVDDHARVMGVPARVRD